MVLKLLNKKWSDIIANSHFLGDITLTADGHPFQGDSDTKSL